MARRSFLSKAGTGAAAVGAAIGAGASRAEAQSATADGQRWQPARHAEDDWFDRVPGKHRMFFDTISPAGLSQAMLFANNYFTANKNGYGLDEKELAVVICVRHQSTAFAFTDAVWAKFGKSLSERAGFTDPKTKAPAIVNVHMQAGSGSAPLDALIKRGVQLAVCQLSVRANAGLIARQTGGKADEIYEELASHLIPNARLVPAGIVAVNRAQEHGYSIAYAG
jgi:intracellular sulfur oxidation DsrE/DsrF family protein